MGVKEVLRKNKAKVLHLGLSYLGREVCGTWGTSITVMLYFLL